MKIYPFHLPELDYQLGDLAPMMSQETLSCHYGKHFQNYVDKLNQLVRDSKYEVMMEQLNHAALQLFGSGWVFLAMNAAKELQIQSLPNGDNPLRYGLTPLLAIDVWEHAYYLDYQNRRAEYLKQLWLLINWHVVSNRVTPDVGFW